MGSSIITWPELDRTAFAVFDSFGAAEEAELEDWRQMTPADRLRAITFMRWTIWGDDAVTGHIQRLLETAERT